MSSKISKDNLQFLGVDYQTGLIKALIEEPRFLSSLYPILDQNCFTNLYLKTIVGTIKDLYKELGYAPTYEHLKIKLHSRANDENDLMYYDEYIEKIQGCTQPIDSVKTESVRFFKQQEVTKLANELKACVLNGLDEKKLASTFKTLDKIRTFGEPTEQITTLNDETIRSALIRKKVDKKIPCGIPEVDDYLGGGAWRGEISLFMAFTGAGKTTWCRTIGFNMALAGYKVLYLYFEEAVSEMEDHSVAQLIGWYPSEVGGMNAEEAEEFIQDLNGKKEKHLIEENYRPVRGKNKYTTVEDIERIIDDQRLRNGFQADVLMIDYFSCLKHSANPTKDPYQAQEDCMRKLENIAFKYDIAIWVTQQTNRQGVQMDEESGIGNIQGSYNATNTCANIIQLLRTEEQQLNSRATLKFWKTRHARKRSNTLEDIFYDNGHSVIRCTAQETFDPVYREDEEDKAPFEGHGF